MDINEPIELTMLGDYCLRCFGLGKITETLTLEPCPNHKKEECTSCDGSGRVYMNADQKFVNGLSKKISPSNPLRNLKNNKV